MVESVTHLALQHLIEKSQIDDESGFFIDRPCNRYIAYVAVSVKIRVRAGSKHL